MAKARLERRSREQVLPALIGVGLSGLTGWGEVVFAHPRAVNVRHTQGLLVSCIAETRLMTSLSICVPALFSKAKDSFAPGDRVRFDGNRLVTEGFIVDFRGRPTWEGTLGGDDVKGFCASKVPLVRETLLTKGREGGFLGLLGKEETRNPFAERTVKLLRRSQNPTSRPAGFKNLACLVGLGPGSTPSGDDFITGILLADETRRLMLAEEAKPAGANQESMVAWPFEKQDLWAAVSRTNDAGRTLLWQALQGHFPWYLITMIRSVSHAEDKEGIEIAVERALQCGATSGTDALVGFVFCFERNLSPPGGISD